MLFANGSARFAAVVASFALLLQAALAQGPAAAPDARPTAPAPSQPPGASPQAGAAPADDVFGEEVVLVEKPILYVRGTANWDNAFDTLVNAFRTLSAYLERQGIKPGGPAMTIYTSTDDTGFEFEAAVPLAEEPSQPPSGGIALGRSPAGKALKFVHRGSYDAMDAIYDAITNHLDEHKLEAKDLFIEEYVTDLLTTPEERLVVNVLVPLK